MNTLSLSPNARVIEAASAIPCPPRAVWKTLTTPELIGQWISMPLAGFEPARGKRFTFQTTPAGAWDGLIRCQIVDLREGERLSYTWESGDEANVGYGSRLDTLVSWDLRRTPQGTQLGLTHSGFVMPKNESSYAALGGGWKKVIERIGEVAAKVPS
ncbi:MAG TPA: SRPBCC domain-containing protein [Ramlibacter sp.]|nr:SRPBCC domain-containing protein [Ramlibacter sp.]